MKTRPFATAVMAISALLVAACGSAGSTATATATSGGGKQLNIYAWAGEIPQAVVTAFEKQTGIKVTIDTFTSNEDMMTKLAAGGSGYDLVEPSQSQIATATSTLEKQKALLGGYNSTNYPQLLASGQACVAEAYSGTVMAQVVASDSHVHFVMPSEGGTLWTDSLSIAAMATDNGDSATANQAAHSYITNHALLNNPAVYPSDSSLTHADFILDPGSALQYFTQGWTQVRAS